MLYWQIFSIYLYFYFVIKLSHTFKAQRTSESPSFLYVISWHHSLPFSGTMDPGVQSYIKVSPGNRHFSGPCGACLTVVQSDSSFAVGGV